MPRLPLVFVCLFVPGIASAQTYCQVPNFRYIAGQPVEARMRTVIASVQRTSKIPGAQPGNWCNLSFNSGMPFYKPIEVVRKPASGEVSNGRYSIRYRSNKAGTDSFMFKLNQIDGRNNMPRETVVTVNVEVVPAPF
jgi:hypothetical protein